MFFRDELPSTLAHAVQTRPLGNEGWASVRVVFHRVLPNASPDHGGILSAPRGHGQPLWR